MSREPRTGRPDPATTPAPSGARSIGRRSASAVVAFRSGAILVLALLAGCEANRDMAPSAEMADTAAVRRAMAEPEVRDALLDTMPGGEMARGDSGAAADLLEDKMP